jgi:hypothetical protein
MLAFLSSLLAQNSVFGEVETPPGVKAYSPGGTIGLIPFITNLIRIATIGAGLFVMVNLIYAGYVYISSSGDAGAHKKVITIVTNSLIGLALIVGSYAATALAGLIFFGDATFILNPIICGPEGC